MYLNWDWIIGMFLRLYDDTWTKTAVVVVDIVVGVEDASVVVDVIKRGCRNFVHSGSL